MNVIQTVHQALLIAVTQLFSPPAKVLENINVQLNTDASKQQFAISALIAHWSLQKRLKKHRYW